MEDLFYKNKEQITKIVDSFGVKILPNKQSDSVFYSKYRKFKYDLELEKIHFDYAPQDVDEFIDEFGDFFENVMNFDAPGVMYNVHPNPNIYSQVASFFSSLANPNFCMDLPSGKLLLIEKAVVNYLNELAGWDVEKASGTFTFGGKGTLLYALKIGLDKANPDSQKRGITSKNFIISNDLGHPSHIEICNWLGIGEENCIRLKTHNAVISVTDIENAFVSIIEQGGRLPLIILNGMTTNNHSFDNVKAVKIIRDKLVKKYKLDYTPHIHVDSVLGWVYLLLSRYDFEKNPLEISDKTAVILQTKIKAASQVKYADSFASDFHKTGYCSYTSSVFLIKDKKQLFSIEGKYSESKNMVFSEYAPYDYTLESSRSPHGPISAYTTLKTLGAEGFTKILANHTDAYLYLKDSFSHQNNVVVCNLEEESNLLFLAFKPKKYLNLEITEETSQTIADEIKEFNTGFYSFILEKSKKGKLDIFFSCSRSYKYRGKSYGCIKIYTFNSHLDESTAKIICVRINQLFNEYTNHKKEIEAHNFFDYAEIKGLENV
ncbi:MAG: pyridoxal-dependent decarboxylase [Patescibacteria group bacterium]